MRVISGTPAWNREKWIVVEDSQGRLWDVNLVFTTTNELNIGVRSHTPEPPPPEVLEEVTEFIKGRFSEAFKKLVEEPVRRAFDALG